MGRGIIASVNSHRFEAGSAVARGREKLPVTPNLRPALQVRRIRVAEGKLGTMKKLPHPIPYQGSKRLLAPTIVNLIPDDVDTLYEPFAGSAAVTLYMAQRNRARRFVIADSLGPIIELWQLIVLQPKEVAQRYAEVWGAQLRTDNHFNFVRDRYNQHRDPVDLLYLICRCVKNAVRFGASGRFTQSPDKRRKGMAPEKMSSAVFGASELLRGKVEFRVGDWVTTLADVQPRDFVYMDPPYLGTTIGADKRYHQQLQLADLVAGLVGLNARGARFALSYDGMTGDKEYAPPLPTDLNLTRLLLHAGRSSQATLNGRQEDTVESLYLSGNVPAPPIRVFERQGKKQQSLSLQ